MRDATRVSSPPSVEVDFTKVFGPSRHAYLDSPPPPPAVDVREAAYDEVESHLREICGEGDWAESGFAEPADRCFVAEQDGRIVAAANLTPWRGHPADVGVLVSPEATGRGLGTAVAARAAAVVIELGGIARYRALETNTPSLRIARKLGFTPYGRNVVVKP
jgi:RimJ/RimL family protein N-acetyltransferase